MKVKITWQQLIYLHDSFLSKELAGTGPYYDLLREHIADFCDIFGRMIDKGAKSYKFRFSSLQARAFMQLWLDQELPQHNGAYVILEMIALLDKESKRPKLLQHETDS